MRYPVYYEDMARQTVEKPCAKSNQIPRSMHLPDTISSGDCGTNLNGPRTKATAIAHIAFTVAKKIHPVVVVVVGGR